MGVPAGLSAVTSAPGTYGFIALLALGAGFELAIWKQGPKKEPGNFGNPVGWGSYDDDMRNKEINNGRFAMFAALGIIAADLVTGKDAQHRVRISASVKQAFASPNFLREHVRIMCCHVK